MKTKIFHTLNSGIFLENNGFGITIDVIHEGSVFCMSSMSDELVNDMRNCRGIFAKTNAMLFTHAHCDHFSKQLLEEYRATEHGKTVAVYCPGYSKSNLPLTRVSDQIDRSVIGPFTVYFITTLHEAEKYKDTYHRAILIKTDEETIFVAGDTVFRDQDTKEIKKYICDTIDIAILNPFQAVEASGKKFISDMDAKKILIYHIPEKKVDKNSYGFIAKTAKKQWPDTLPFPIVIPLMSLVNPLIESA
jgi:L-ascorbate metabolism protein UlaG (beta-lactamase superfamily)